VRGQRHAPATLYPRERPGTHCTGGCLGHRTGLDRCGKSRPPPEFDPRTVQPVASRYTDWATRPTVCICSYLKLAWDTKFSFSDTYHPGIPYLCENRREELWLFFGAKRGPRAKKFESYCSGLIHHHRTVLNRQHNVTPSVCKLRALSVTCIWLVTMWGIFFRHKTHKATLRTSKFTQNHITLHKNSNYYCITNTLPPPSEKLANVYQEYYLYSI